MSRALDCSNCDLQNQLDVLAKKLGDEEERDLTLVARAIKAECDGERSRKRIRIGRFVFEIPGTRAKEPYCGARPSHQAEAEDILKTSQVLICPDKIPAEWSIDKSQ
jgi:hypothetical protein